MPPEIVAMQIEANTCGVHAIHNAIRLDGSTQLAPTIDKLKGGVTFHKDGITMPQVNAILSSNNLPYVSMLTHIDPATGMDKADQSQGKSFIAGGTAKVTLDDGSEVTGRHYVALGNKRPNEGDPATYFVDVYDSAAGAHGTATVPKVGSSFKIHVANNGRSLSMTVDSTYQLRRSSTPGVPPPQPELEAPSCRGFFRDLFACCFRSKGA